MPQSTQPRQQYQPYCERCSTFTGPFKRHVERTTLGHPIYFTVCADVAACLNRVQAKPKRVFPPAQISDLYS